MFLSFSSEDKQPPKFAELGLVAIDGYRQAQRRREVEGGRLEPVREATEAEGRALLCCIDR